MEIDIKSLGLLRFNFHNLKGYKTFLMILFLFIPFIHSQELITDRPDQTESAVTVPVNSLQVETGFLYEGFKETVYILNSGETAYTFDNYSIASTLLRYGILDNVEIRLGAGYLISKAAGASINGLGDFLFGTKINFLNEENDFMDMAIMAHTSLPVGNESLNSDEFEPEIIASLSKSLSEKFSLGINLGGFYISSAEEINFMYTAALGTSLTNEIGFFAEVFGNFFTAGVPFHSIDGGFTFLIAENVQLDISGGKGLSGIDSYWFMGTGVSFRIDEL